MLVLYYCNDFRENFLVHVFAMLLVLNGRKKLAIIGSTTGDISRIYFK